MTGTASFFPQADLANESASGRADVADVRRWLNDLERHVQNVDYVEGRSIFSEGMVTFGTFARTFLIGREETEQKQWRNVWGTIDNIDFLGDDMQVLISSDRRVAVSAVPFQSVGFYENGSTFHRTGRATIVLTRNAVMDPWVAQHTHMSLDRGVPRQSYGNKPELCTLPPSSAGPAVDVSD